MSSRTQRVNDGINRLVRRLLVEIPGEDPALTDEREQNAVDFVTEVLGRYDSNLRDALCSAVLIIMSVAQSHLLLLPT